MPTILGYVSYPYIINTQESVLLVYLFAEIMDLLPSFVNSKSNNTSKIFGTVII